MIQNKEKCIGAMVSAGIGDALGWAFSSRNQKPKLAFRDEYIAWQRSVDVCDFQYEETIQEGEYSGQIQLLLAVSRSIIIDDWQTNFTRKELPFWLKYERGDELALKQIAYCYRENGVPWSGVYKDIYFEYDRSVSVRVLPHVISNCNQAVDDVLKDVALNAITTHGHPKTILGAMCYGYAVHTIFQKNTTLEYGELIATMLENIDIWGKMPTAHFSHSWILASEEVPQYHFAKVWDETLADMKRHLQFILQSLGNGILCHDDAVLGGMHSTQQTYDTADISVLSALYLFSKYATNPTLAIKTAIVMKDHGVASMTASLVGALFGTDYIPLKWQNLQDRKCFSNLCEILLSDDMKSYAKKITGTAKQETHIATTIGKVKRIESNTLTVDRAKTIRIDRYQSLLDQSIYTKKYKVVNEIDVPYELYGGTGDPKKTIEIQAEPVETEKKVSLAQLGALAEALGKSRVGFKKMMTIINDVAENESSVALIMKRHDVDESVANCIHTLLEL